jgi:DNA-binding transcriptional MerR regulator
MPLAQMIRFAQLHRQGPSIVSERRILLEEHHHSLEHQMRQLEQHTAALQLKIARLRAREAAQAAASHPAKGVGQSDAASAARPLGKGMSANRGKLRAMSRASLVSPGKIGCDVLFPVVFVLNPTARIEAAAPRLCLSRLLIGMPCPGCGMTRALHHTRRVLLVLP